MKRSELIRRLAAAGAELMATPLTVSSAEDAVLFARALGIEVEPDEPELPDRLNFRHATAEDETCWAFCGDYELRMTAGPSSMAGHAAHSRLAWAMCVAYNATRWRSGTPEREGWYTVRFGRNEHEWVTGIRLWSGSEWQWPAGRRDLSAPVDQTAWMPLPPAKL
jgi:hypothetical protein